MSIPDKPDTPPAAGSCCTAEVTPQTVEEPSQNGHSSCCEPVSSRIDWFLWATLSLVLVAYSLQLLLNMSTVEWSLPPWAGAVTATVFELVNTMWWSVLLATVFVGVLGQIPQSLVISVLGRGGSVSGLWRATLAGVLMDLCSHGILMVGMQLYRKGASLGQVMAFLVASPWNSLSLTLILIALIGWQWTLAFVLLSMLLAITTGWVFDRCCQRGLLPDNPHQLPESAADGLRFSQRLAQHWKNVTFNQPLLAAIWHDAIQGARIVVRWLLFGILLAAMIRAFVSVEVFADYFGPSLIGLLLTLLAATIIEVCSEGSTPIAADIMTRANAPGNSFAFLMTGVATDYTEVMVIRDTYKSWRVALFLPLITVPQVVIVALILNQLG